MGVIELRKIFTVVNSHPFGWLIHKPIILPKLMQSNKPVEIDSSIPVKIDDTIQL